MNDDRLLPVSLAVLTTLQNAMPMLTHTQEQAIFMSLLTADLVAALDEGGFLK